MCLCAVSYDLIPLVLLSPPTPVMEMPAQSPERSQRRPQQGLGRSQWSRAPLTLPDVMAAGRRRFGAEAWPVVLGPRGRVHSPWASEQTVNTSGAGWPSMGADICVLETMDAAVHARCQVCRKAAGPGSTPKCQDAVTDRRARQGVVSCASVTLVGME